MINTQKPTMADHEAALAREYGLVDHPKLALLYSIAWDLGHAYGHDEVEIYFERLVPLIR